MDAEAFDPEDDHFWDDILDAFRGRAELMPSLEDRPAMYRMRMSNAGERRPRRTGRRPGTTLTCEAILDAARRQFGSVGYERSSLRAIAAEAGVDQALILHFFGSKMGLFLEVVDLPVDPQAALPVLVSGPRDEIGLRVATFVIGVLENEEARAIMTSLVRAATSEPEAARLVRDRLTYELWGPLAEQLEAGDAELRVSLVGSQMVGLVLARYVVQVEPLASLSPEEVISAIAPTLQRYLVGEL